MDEHRGLIIFAIVNAVLGLALFEWAWYKTRRFRNPIIELNAQFPELSRNDAPHWRKWKLYPGALTIMLPRFVGLLAIGGVMWLLLKFWLCCHKPEKPMGRCRRCLVRWTFKISMTFMGLMWFTWYGYEYISDEQVNNYEEYLGPLLGQ